MTLNDLNRNAPTYPYAYLNSKKWRTFLYTMQDCKTATCRKLQLELCELNKRNTGYVTKKTTSGKRQCCSSPSLTWRLATTSTDAARLAATETTATVAAATTAALHLDHISADWRMPIRCRRCLSTYSVKQTAYRSQGLASVSVVIHGTRPPSIWLARDLSQADSF